MPAKSLCKVWSVVLWWMLSFEEATGIQQNPAYSQRDGLMHFASQLQLASGVKLGQLLQDDSDSQDNSQDSFVVQMFREESSGSSELKKSDGQPVELLRFITPYRTGLDSFVDVTPYSQLLQQGEPLHFYSFIDTWVSNDTMSKAAYMNNRSKLCSVVNHSDGNGWLLSADLIFSSLPQDSQNGSSLASVNGKRSASELLSLQPRAVVPLVDDTLTYRDFGRVTMHEAVLNDDGMSGMVPTVKLSKDHKQREEFQQALKTSQSVPVYDCDKGKNSFARSVMVMHNIDELSRAMDKGDNVTDTYEQDLLKFVLGPSLAGLNVNDSDVPKQQVTVSFNKSLVNPVEGLPVFFDGAFTDTWMEDDKMWWNSSTPFKPAGSVLSVGNGSAVIKLNCACVPTAESGWLPNLIMPKDHHSWIHAQAFLEDIKERALKKHLENKIFASLATSDKAKDLIPLTLPSEGLLGFLDTSSQDSPNGYPLLAKSTSEMAYPNAADLSQFAELKAISESKSSVADSTTSTPKKKVCVITQQIHGRLLDQEFEMPVVTEGERIVAQVTPTGHGWAATQEQCGEYCKVKYHLKFDDGSPVEFMQWRDDCKQNPNGVYQHGTWFESRNGWCPGAVNPGVFLDVTDAVNDLKGKHRMTLDTLVYSSRTGQYEPFTDWDGWMYGDNANLRLAITLFIYPKKAVTAAQNEGRRSCTRASAALRSNTAAGAQWPPELVTKTTTPGASLLRSEDVHCSLDFESKSPWYLWNNSASTSLETTALNPSSRWVSVMSTRMVQGSSRVQKAQLDPALLPSSWGQVGLRLRLERPEGKLDFDHWDRIGSVGLLLLNKGKDAAHPGDGIVEVGPRTSPQRQDGASSPGDKHEKGFTCTPACSFIILVVCILASFK